MKIKYTGHSCFALTDGAVGIEKAANEIDLSLEDIQGKKMKIIVMDKE